MSNVPESASYDAGIYQLETVDEVLGGVNGKANAQAKGLANRTKWLKSQVDALNALKGKGVVAFSIANSYLAGEIVDYQKNIYRANTTVTPGAWNASQWNKLLGTAAENAAQTSATDDTANALMAVGAFGLGSQSAVIIPGGTLDSSSIPAGLYRVEDTLAGTWPSFGAVIGTCIVSRTSSGSIIQMLFPQSSGKAVFRTVFNNVPTAWVEIAPLDSPNFTGSPTAPTPATTDNDTSVATTAFVQAQKIANLLDNTPGLAMTVGAFGLGTTSMAVVDDLNSLNVTGLYSPTSSTLNIPPSVISGSTCLHISSSTAHATQIVWARSIDRIFSRRKSSSVWSPWVELYHSGNATFDSSLATNGYMKHPSGIIVQWGVKSGVNNSAGVNVTFPIAFPTGAFAVVATHQAPGSGPASRIVETVIRSGTYFDAYGNTTANAIYWIAIGY